MDSSMPRPMCGAVLNQRNQNCPSCGDSIPPHPQAGSLFGLSKGLETQRRVARFLLIFSVVMLVAGWIPVLAIVGISRHLMPGIAAVEYIPDAVMVASAVLGVGGGILWLSIDRRRTNLPMADPDARSELN